MYERGDKCHGGRLYVTGRCDWFRPTWECRRLSRLRRNTTARTVDNAVSQEF